MPVKCLNDDRTDRWYSVGVSKDYLCCLALIVVA